ncbi:hypothetical protein N780_17835 [Pontibacillus chungwhensis BH030062]|uniref:Cytoplasmic protein n=1 Tax=Pontibacillus chungwhensis BH030062 TaxID=1385513 RepID=A0A0A2VBR1_9BACI|nr:DUF1456 family protein [Pontibacillus chungwhensis]KGP91110.1 hypothetical protein N780_17835 [Pontibacillus chungwhensis BH030062]
MINNDRLIRLRYALDLKNEEMVEIFELGGMTVTKEEVGEMLTKPNDSYSDDLEEAEETVDDETVERFLNGLIIYKRGKQEPKPGQPERPALSGDEWINNVLLKKLRIALKLTSEDMLEVFDQAGVHVTKGQLSALLRKKGHKHYKDCGDKFARSFLKGLTVRYRG